MVNFSYTVFPFFRKQIEEIDLKRQRILLTLISPKDEMQLRWETLIRRIYYSLILKNINFEKEEIINLLSLVESKHQKSKDKECFSYKKACDYIKQNWLISPLPISIEIVKELSNFLGIELSNDEIKGIKNFLNFIQVNPEHPIIQTALAHILLLQNISSTPGNKQLACLISTLILYKNGYDFRGLLNLEEHFFQDKKNYQHAVLDNTKNTNVSSFIEYFIIAMEKQSNKAFEKVSVKNFEINLPSSFFKLTERQKEILSLLDQPGIRITNKMIQRLFKVSQITASRDLAKLNSLQIVFPVGKGRSTSYTKV